MYAENSPQRVYFLILYNLFAEFLDDINEDVLPNDRTGYQDTQVWNALYNFQKDAATGIINKLETYNGCILADSVGLGKTFTALAVIKYYELRNKSVAEFHAEKLIFALLAAAVPGAPASPACRARSTSAGSRGAGAAASSDDDAARGPAPGPGQGAPRPAPRLPPLPAPLRPQSPSRRPAKTTCWS